jgi:O-methyltransferase
MTGDSRLGPAQDAVNLAATDGVFVSEYFDWRQRKPSRPIALINKVLRRVHSPYYILPPIYTGNHTNVERRLNIFHLLSAVLCYGIPGDIVEVGCNAGQTSVLLERIIEHHDPRRTLHLYDSFEGLPEASKEDTNTPYREGWMKVSPDTVLENFRRFGLRAPQIHPGWFDATLPKQLPNKISFAYLDGDFYSSILVSLEHVYPRLVHGAVCVVDDYCDPARCEWNLLPGVKMACDEFFSHRAERVESLYAGDTAQGYFRKL